MNITIAPHFALASAFRSLPSSYTVLVEERAGVKFYRAMCVNGPEWICATLRGTYEAAEADARLHSVGARS